VCDIFPVKPVSSGVVHWSRNWLIAELIKSQQPWTHALFIDDDIVCPSDALIKMLAHKKDIVAGICTRRTDPPIPNIRVFDEKTGLYSERWSWPKDELIEVGAVGTGLMLISRHALEQVAEAYFQCLYEKEIYGIDEEHVSKLRNARLKFFDDNANAYWFRFLTCLNGDFEMGEDVSFCFMAKRYCDIPIYCDTSIQPGHVGQYVYSIADFLPHQEAAIRRAKAAQFAQKRAQEPKPDVAQGVISVMIPALEHPEKSIAQLKATASKPELLEILVNSEPLGYARMHEYYNEMAARSTGDWLMLWNDDAIMKEPGWDEKIRNAGSGLTIVNMTGQLNLFPVVHRSIYELLGHISLQTHSDTWLQVVGRECLIEKYVPIAIKHERTEIRKEYEKTSPQFFQETNVQLMMEDVKKIMGELEKEAVPVG